MASKLLTPDQQNFTRLVIVCVDLIKLVLKDVLRSKIKPADLYNAISSCVALTSGRLRPEQQRLCYLPTPNIPDYNKFDITLLYTLIRNLCPSIKPTLGWGNTPSKTAIQIGDDIERLRIFRNEVHGHCESSNVTDTEFCSRWLDIETAIRRVEALLSSQGLSVNYEKELKKIKNLDLGSEDMDKYKLLLEGMMCLLKKSENEDMPKILIHGEDKVTCGEVACFKVDVESSSMAAPWSVTWQRVRGDTTEQINISTEKYRDSNDRQLVIQRVSKADEGGYQAVLSRHNLKVTSNSIFLVATGDPPVLQTMDVSTGLDGITLHYQYTVTSHSPNVHHIAWMRNGKILGIDLLKYIGGGIDDGRLTITSPTLEDAGQYTCIVANAVAAVSQSLPLDIPSVTVSAEVPVYVGGETKIDSVVAACPPPEGATWQKSSDSVIFENINIDIPRHYGSTNDPSNPVLTITKATFDDKLYYRLLVWNKIGQRVSNTVYLNVTGGPPNISNSQETNIQNRSVTLTCEIFLYENSPMLQELCWMKNNDVLDIAGSGGKLAGGTITNPSLVINNINEFDAGSYQCKASNAVGSTLGNIIVLGIPDVDVIENTTNDTQVFTAVLTSIPAPIQVQWSVKNELTGDWAPVDTNSEEYKGTTDSLPQPVLVVKRKERIKIHSFQMTVKNFIGIKTKLIPDGRTCLQNDKEDPKDDALHPIFSKKGSTIRFNNLLLQIIDEIPREDLGTLKRSLGVMTSIRTALSNVTSVGEFIDCLLEEELVKERNVIMMQYLLRSIKRPDLEMKCVEYATMNKQALCYYEEINISGDRHKQIKLHVVNNIDNFNDMDSLLATVASIVGCEPSSIKVVGIYPENSFIIVMMVKMEFARVLLHKDQNELMELLKFNVDWIQIEDKVIRIQQKEIEEKADQHEQKTQKRYGKPEELAEHSDKMRKIAEFQQKHTKIEEEIEEKADQHEQKTQKRYGKPEELAEHSDKMRKIAEFQQKHTKIEEEIEEKADQHEQKTQKRYGKPEELAEHSDKMRKIAELQQKLKKIDEEIEEKADQHKQKTQKRYGKPEELPEHVGRMRINAEFQQKHTKIEGKPEGLPEHVGKMRIIAEFQQKHTKIEGKPEEVPEHSGKMRKIEDASLSHKTGSSATQISSITVPGVDDVSHICVVTSDRLWVSDEDGRLLQVDSTGHVLHDKLRARTVFWFTGSQTVTENGDLLFINNNEVRKFTSDGTVTILPKTNWGALYIHSSRINGDILVGSDDRRVTRYDRTGRELQVIEKNNKGQRLYEDPIYITENQNGDILVSDWGKNAVVVADKSGRHRFDYTGRQSDYKGRQSPFYPHGICTDVLGHVLVCDYYNGSVHLLDQDGQFLSLLLTNEQHGIYRPTALCVDDQHNLYLGQWKNNTINVYKYLQDADVK